MSADGEKAELQTYMDTIVPTLNAALNKIAKERPDDILAALIAELSAAKPLAAAAAAPPAGGDDGGDVNYAEALTVHLTAALHAVLGESPADPYKAIQKVLFQVSLTNAEADPARVTVTPEMKEYILKYSLQSNIDTCVMKKGKGTGPKSGVKFMVSDAGDYFTELSKKLKDAGGVPVSTTMTAEELAAKDKADMLAKREKEAKADAERDAQDAINAEKTRLMEADGKKVGGGLHKFDSSEVDVHGGSGTADDFMDAFGF